MRQSNLFIAVIILGAAILLFFFGLTVLTENDKEANEGAVYSDPIIVPLKRPTLTFGNPTLGPSDAAVTIFAFGDYSCEPCANVSASLLQIRQEYPKDLRIVWKDMPNPNQHVLAIDAAAAARCAGDQGAFWEYHTLLMGQQASLDAKNFTPLAAQLKLDLDSFQSCVDNKRDVPVVSRDMLEGLRLGIDATPYLFINERVVKGDVGLVQLQGFVDAEMAKVGKPLKQRTEE